MNISFKWALRGDKATKKMGCFGVVNLDLVEFLSEAQFSKSGWKELCPVLFSVPGGFLVVIPRCQTLQDALPQALYELFINQPDYCVPAENKSDSFGWYKGRLVAIDYG